MSNKNKRKTPTWKLFTALFLILFFLIAIIGELFLRSIHYGVKPSVTPPYDTALKDELFGWVMKPNYSYSGKKQDKAGVEYDIDLKFDENGFKMFGNIQSTKPKVLFIGDSYTASVESSNDKTFYKLVADSIDIEVFAYGHAGYGNLQEFMILDKWVDKIKPDIIVMEVCSNDFIDNYAPLEIECGYKVGERRPYLDENQTITYYRPLSLAQKLKEKSRFFNWFSNRLENSWYNITKIEKRVGEYYISTERTNYEPYKNSIEITNLIIDKIKSRIPSNAKFLAFSADSYQPAMDDFKYIFESKKLQFSTIPVKKVDAFEYFKMGNVRTSDGYHWNNQGQELIASGIIEELKKLLPNQQSN
ncbi:MAG: SGNH/GDSL hydrolase family protein [Saprospiraceae bacterium]|nr:SGNH/GDSL hydrolase family protein [Saprospiraceae bacterium]